jgi:uncharacterized protein YbjT (DUF2867 family)
VKVLVTGVTGHIGSRLAPLLVESGHEVRVLVRARSRLPDAPWISSVEVVEGDIARGEGLGGALTGVEAAYYLVHGMGAGVDFHEREKQMSERFADAVKSAGIPRIIYLGALGDPESRLTEHLQSRHETGQRLAASGVDTVELRAGPVVGAGSLPFEMIRYLTERVPVMVCPRWVYTKVQPIALRDVLSYLVASLDAPLKGHQVIEIGGSQILSYGDMMTTYARARGLHRLMIRVPVLTPRLSSYWVHLLTPLRSSFARLIVEGLRNEVVVRDRRAHEFFPLIEPLDYVSSVQMALHELTPGESSEPRLTSEAAEGRLAKEVRNQEGMISERRSLRIKATPDQVFDAFSSLGGQNGWYLNWGRRLRGALDQLIGGPGLRISHPARKLSIGDQVDFWRVEAMASGQRLLLRAEMKLPGAAWLEFNVVSLGEGGTLLSQTSYFAPKGLAGALYWYALLPLHKLVFNGLIRRVGRIATEIS